MDKKELTTIYEQFLKQINDIWRSLWPRKQTKKIRKTR